MQLNDILDNVEDQDKGRWFDLKDPLTGKVTDIRFLVVGPDSSAQGRARLKFSDELAELSDADGRVSAEDREKARLNSLARCVIGWEIMQNGEAIPFNHTNVVRVLRSASWVQQQVDSFADDRSAFWGAM